MDINKESSKLESGPSVKHPPAARLATVLLVDDSPDTRLMTKWFLDYAGCIVHAFSDVEDALAQFDPKIHDLVLTDNSMKPMTGAEMIPPSRFRPDLDDELSAFLMKACVPDRISRFATAGEMRDALRAVRARL